jgi:hypothetical protein
MDSQITNSNPFDDNTIQKIKENDIYYYIVPSGFPLFKATKNEDDIVNNNGLDPTKFYFFGVKNMDPKYIKSYEKEYGIIFEFTTTREYKLLALDDKATQTKLYKMENITEDIKQILEENYGYENNERDSDNDKDRKLSEFLCSNNFDGYAIHNMKTQLGGTFHDELMICKMDGINTIGKLITERVEQILEDTKLKSYAPKKKERPARFFNDVDNDNKVNRKLFGGIKKRSYKKRSNKKRKTVKKCKYCGNKKR